MNMHRLALGYVGVNPESGDLAIERDPEETDEAKANLYCQEAYSSFKYGDGYLAEQYGRQLADLVFKQRPELADQDTVYVTSSAYKVAPPASYSLMEPFCQAAGQMMSDQGSDLKLKIFKIDRANVAPGDYATMNLAGREAIIQGNGSSIEADIDLGGRSVIVLDDVYVTGSHEKSLARILAPEQPSDAYFGYILKVAPGANPKVESDLNGLGVGDIDRLIDLANHRLFTPNARVCKYLLSQTIDDLEHFCSSVPDKVIECLSYYIRGDGLDLMPAYSLGSLAFHEMISPVAAQG